jgi:hypothetical protein
VELIDEAELEAELEAAPSSAYLLFYMRKDVQGVDLNTLLSAQRVAFSRYFYEFNVHYKSCTCKPLLYR